MRSRATIKWAGLALAGLLIAVGVAIAAGNLAGRQIGLASEPISAGDALAPAASPNRGHGSTSQGNGGHRPSPVTTTTTTPESTVPTVPSPEPESTIPASPSHEPSDDRGGGQGADD
jgi:hypothetical protein